MIAKATNKGMPQKTRALPMIKSATEKTKLPA